MDPIVKVVGKMADSKFESSDTCLVVAINASSFKMGGIAKELASVYDYANLFEGRRQMFHLNRTHASDRPDVGSIIVKAPPPNVNSPYIIGLISQFGVGDDISVNEIAMHYAQTSKDKHYVNGLRNDTLNSRINYFRQALNQLAEFAVENKGIRQIVMPMGIGRAGRNDTIWNRSYLPHIEDVAFNLLPKNIQVLISELPREAPI